MKLQIMSPAAVRVDYETPPAPRLNSLEGKTIGLYHNMTGGADIAVERAAERLGQRYPSLKFRALRRRPAAGAAGAQPRQSHRRRRGRAHRPGGGRRHRRHGPLRRLHVVACP